MSNAGCNIKTSRRRGLGESAGFSLVELLISLALSAVLAALVAVSWNSFSRLVQTQVETHRVESELRVALVALTSAVRHAGNHALSVDPGITCVSPSEVHLLGDRSGSAPQNQGEPDGDFTQSFEDLRFRLNPRWATGNDEDSFSRDAQLQVKSGNGTFQPLASGIERFRCLLLDRGGSATADPTAAETLRLDLVGRARKRAVAPARIAISLELPLHPRRHQLFIYP